MCFGFFKKEEESAYAKFDGKDVTVSLKNGHVYFGKLKVVLDKLSITYVPTPSQSYFYTPPTLNLSSEDIVFIQEGDHSVIEDVTYTSDEQDVELNRYKVTLILKENNEVSFIFDETIQKRYTGAVTHYGKKSVDDVISDFLYKHTTKIPDDTHRFIAQGCIISASAKLIKGHTRKDKTYSSYTEKARKLKGCVCKNETTTMATR